MAARQAFVVNAPAGMDYIAGETAIANDLRCNERIRISPIRLIDENNEQAGIVEVHDAQERAREAGLEV